MPMDKSRYPSTWEIISKRIRQQAGNRCEICAVANGSIVERTPGKQTKIVLTAHHIGVPRDDEDYGDPHDKMDCREVNIIILCQMHHLAADAEIRKLEDRWYRKGFREVCESIGHLSDEIVAHPCQGPIYNRLREIALRRTHGPDDGAEHGPPDHRERISDTASPGRGTRIDEGARPLPAGQRGIPRARSRDRDQRLAALGDGTRERSSIHGSGRSPDASPAVRAHQRKGMPLQQRVLDLLSTAPRPLTTAEIARQLSFTQSGIGNALTETDTAGDTTRSKYGRAYRYRITEQGRTTLGLLRRRARTVPDQEDQRPGAKVR